MLDATPIAYPTSRYLRALLGSYTTSFDQDHTEPCTDVSLDSLPDIAVATAPTCATDTLIAASPRSVRSASKPSLALDHLKAPSALPLSCRRPLTPPPTDSEDEIKRLGHQPLRVHWQDQEEDTPVASQDATPGAAVDVLEDSASISHDAKREEMWRQLYPFVDLHRSRPNPPCQESIKIENQVPTEETLASEISNENKSSNDDNEGPEDADSDEEVIHYVPSPSAAASSASAKPLRPLRHATIQSLSHKTPNPIRHPRGVIPPPSVLATLLAIDSDISDSAPVTLPEPFRRPPTPDSRIRTRRLAQDLGGTFPAEAELLKRYIDDPEEIEGCACGGKVEWVDGVGRLVGCVCEIVREGEEGAGTGVEDGNVHVFMDHSNVLNSYLASLPYDRLTATKRRSLSMPILTLLFRRGRRTAPNGMHLVGSSPLQQNLDQAVRLGWQCNVLKRVPVTVKEERPSKNRSHSCSSAANSKKSATTTDTTSSDSDRPFFPPPSVKKMREQAVDELLHLKILQTLLLAPYPGTIVLATGDAAASQYNSHGFVGCVREALKRGWRVELWAFRNGMSRSWVDTARREKWTEQGGFVLWALDNWLDELTELQER